MLTLVSTFLHWKVCRWNSCRGLKDITVRKSVVASNSLWLADDNCFNVQPLQLFVQISCTQFANLCAQFISVCSFSIHPNPLCTFDSWQCSNALTLTSCPFKLWKIKLQANIFDSIKACVAGEMLLCTPFLGKTSTDGQLQRDTYWKYILKPKHCQRSITFEMEGNVVCIAFNVTDCKYRHSALSSSVSTASHPALALLMLPPELSSFMWFLLLGLFIN